MTEPVYKIKKILNDKFDINTILSVTKVIELIYYVDVLSDTITDMLHAESIEEIKKIAEFYGITNNFNGNDLTLINTLENVDIYNKFNEIMNKDKE